MLEKTLESPLDCKEIKQVNPKGNQPWIFIGRTDAKAETLILWPPDAKNWLTGKDPYAGKDWGQEEKGTTEDEMVARHHWLNGCEFEQTLRDSEGPGSLVCCSPWDLKESDTTRTEQQQKEKPEQTFWPIQYNGLNIIKVSFSLTTQSKVGKWFSSTRGISNPHSCFIVSQPLPRAFFSSVKSCHKEKRKSMEVLNQTQWSTNISSAICKL